MTAGRLSDRTAVDLQRLLHRGDVSATEVLDDHLARIDECNTSVNAIVTLVPDLARRRAAELDDAFARTGPVGPLHGLPVAHKDLAWTAGIRTTFGSPLFADNVPDTDSLIVARMRAAGAVTVGKTNTPEFGAGSQTFNPVFGATLNPWDLDRTCGGSSGGAAVALACRMVALADGSDMGGSLRNPASFCGVVGLRPAPGRVPSTTTPAPYASLSVDGPMGRTVADTALLLDAIAGDDPRSPIGLTSESGAFSAALDGVVAGRRVAWSPDLGGLPFDPSVVETLAPARQVLVDLGCDVVDDFPDLSGAREVFQVMRAWQFEIGFGGLLDRAGDQLKDTIRWNIEEARRRPLTDHADATRLQGQIFARMHQFMSDIDYVVCPVSQVPPFPVETEWIDEVDGVQMETYIDWMRSCTDISTTGHPAISVPGGFTPDGLPIGLQIVGRHRAERSVLELAHAFECATRWTDRRPPMLGS